MGSLDPNGQGFAELISEGLCTNCTVLAGKTMITFEDGSEAGPRQGVYVHHVVNRDITKPPNLPVSKCGPGQTPQDGFQSLAAEFLAQGDDQQNLDAILFTSKDGKFNSGYFVGPDMVLLNLIDLVNYNAESKKVYVTFDIEYVNGHVGSDAAATLMSVTGCNNAVSESPGSPSIKLDKNGIAITESPRFAVTRDSKIVAASESKIVDTI
jgi:hypothetical protein